jgi:predicted RNase H-like nuclease
MQMIHSIHERDEDKNEKKKGINDSNSLMKVRCLDQLLRRLFQFQDQKIIEMFPPLFFCWFNGKHYAKVLPSLFWNFTEDRIRW